VASRHRPAAGTKGAGSGKSFEGRGRAERGQMPKRKVRKKRQGGVLVKARTGKKRKITKKAPRLPSGGAHPNRDFVPGWEKNGLKKDL